MCTVTASLDGVGACPINAAPSIGGTRHEPVDPCPFSASRGVIVLAPCLLSSLHPRRPCPTGGTHERAGELEGSYFRVLRWACVAHA